MMLNLEPHEGEPTAKTFEERREESEHKKTEQIHRRGHSYHE